MLMLLFFFVFKAEMQQQIMLERKQEMVNALSLRSVINDTYTEGDLANLLYINTLVVNFVDALLAV